MMEKQEIDTKALDEDSEKGLEISNKFEIKTQKDYTTAGLFVKGRRALIKQIKETFAAPKKKLNEAKSSLLDAERKHLKPAEESMRIAECKMTGFYEKQEEKRRTEQARLDEIARKKAEREREREAKRAEKKGEEEAAEEIRSQDIIPTPAIAPKLTAPEGISTRITLSAEVMSLKDLVKAAAEEPGRFLIYLQADQVRLNKAAKLFGEKDFNIPGVRIRKATGLAVRA